MHGKLITTTLGFLFLLGIPGTAAEAPPLTFKFTKANVPGARGTIPVGVNNAGATVGAYLNRKLVWHGYILDGKKLTTLDDPAGTPGTTYADGLNPDGTISVVGHYLNSSGNSVGFLYKKGKYKDIGPTGFVASIAVAITDQGVIVGDYTDTSGVTHGFILEGKKYTTLDVPGSAGTTAAAGINKAGWIVLWWVDSKGSVQASLTKNRGKSYRTIDVPGATDSYPGGINSAGDVTYYWEDSDQVGCGALFHAKKYYKFDYPHATFTAAAGINDRATLVGAYLSTTGPISGFKATY
jgi:hypothetical protein